MVILEAERVRALWALRSIGSKKMLAAVIESETHFLGNEEKEKSIQEYVDKETAVARKQVEDAERAIKQDQEDMRNADEAGFTTWEPKNKVTRSVILSETVWAIS